MVAYQTSAQRLALDGSDLIADLVGVTGDREFSETAGRDEVPRGSRVHEYLDWERLVMIQERSIDMRHTGNGRSYMDSTHRWAWRTDGTGVENMSVRPTIEAEALGNVARSFRRGEVIVICDHWFGRRLGLS